MNSIEIFKYLLLTDFVPKVIIPFLSAFVGFLGALMIYLLRNNHERKTEGRNRQRLLSEKLTYFAAVLSTIVKSTKLQINEMESYIKLLEENPLEFHYFNIVINEGLKRVSERIDQSEIYHANSVYFRTDMEKAKILNCLTSIDFLHQVSYQVIAFNKENFDHVVKLEKEYRDLSESILDKSAHEIRNPRNPGRLISNGFYSSISKIMNDYYSEVTTQETIDLRQKYFINPFIDLYPSSKDYEFMNEIIVDLKNCSHLYNEIIQTIEFIATTIEKYKGRQEVSLKNVEEYYNLLKKNGFLAT